MPQILRPVLFQPFLPEDEQGLTVIVPFNIPHRVNRRNWLDDRALCRQGE